MAMDTGIDITYRGALQLGIFLGLLVALALDRYLNKRNQELDQLYNQEEVTEEEVMRHLEDQETIHKETSRKETNNKKQAING